MDEEGGSWKPKMGFKCDVKRTHLKPSEQKNAMIKFILKGWGINEMQGWEAVYQEFWDHFKANYWGIKRGEVEGG